MRNRLAQARAKKLRSKPTDAERLLWYHLRARRLGGQHFRRQVPIGPYIADFANLEQQVIVEVDGRQHRASDHDVRRDQYLAEQGFRVLRFWDNQVLMETEAVLEVILRAFRSQDT